MIERNGQEPSLEQTVHALAKPVTRALAWTATALATLGLAAAAARTAREG